MAQKSPSPAELQHGDTWMASLAFFDRRDRALFRLEALPALQRVSETLSNEDFYE